MEAGSILNPLSLTLGATGLVFLIMGYIQRRNPPKNINWFFGYRTSAAMRNQERWDFAQRESARAVMHCGVALVLLAVPSMFLWPPSMYQLYLAILILVAAVIYVFWRVQSGLRKRFGP